MKNAKEHVIDFITMYENERQFKDKLEALVDPVILICRRLIDEIKEIALARKAHCDSAWRAIIKEQDRKWKAIVRRLPDDLDKIVNQDAFNNVWEHFKNEVDRGEF